AKFSLRHTAAMALAGEETGSIEAFDDDRVNQPAVLALRERVELRTGRKAGGPTPVEVQLNDGRVLHAAHDVSVPETDLPLQRRRLLEKFGGLVRPVLGEQAADDLAAAALTVDQLTDVGSLVRVTART